MPAPSRRTKLALRLLRPSSYAFRVAALVGFSGVGFSGAGFSGAGFSGIAYAQATGGPSLGGGVFSSSAPSDPGLAGRGTDTIASQGYDGGPLSSGFSTAPPSSLIFTPGVTVAESYTDNINLNPKGQERSDFITAISPSLGITENTERLKFSIIYDPQAIFYARSQSPDKFDQQLQGTGQGIIIPEYLFFDTSASIEREFVSGNGPFANNTFTTNGNLQSVSAVSASPYLKLHYSDFAKSETRYRFDDVNTGGGSIAPSQTNEFYQTVSSGPTFGRVDWTLLLDYTYTDRLAASGDPLANTSLRDQVQEVDGGYRLTQDFSLTGAAGYERIVDQTVQGLSGPKWNGGFRYQPRPTTTVNITYGRHYHQPDLEVHIVHDIDPTIHFTGDYSKTARTSQDLLAGNLGILGVSTTGSLINTTTGLPFSLSNGPVGTTSSPFGINSGITLDTRLQAALDAKRGRNDFFVSIYDEKQSGQIGTTSNQHVTGASFSYERDLQPTLRAGLVTNYFKSKYTDGSGRKDDTYSVSLTVDKRLTQTLSAELAFSRFDTESSSAQNTVVSDVVLFSLAKQF